MLLSCDLLATKGQNEISENSPSPDARAARTRAQLKNRSQLQLTNVTTCFGSHMPKMVVQWKELGLTDPNAIECSNFFPACVFFFYIDELAKAAYYALTDEELKTSSSQRNL